MNFLRNSQPVTIVRDKLGNIVRQTSNPEYSYIVLSQKRTSLKDGWVNEKKYTALLKGRTDTLKAISFGKIKELPGNIVVRESTKQSDPNDPNRNLKIAGDSGIILCTKDGEPIYRETFYDPSGMEHDILIQHQKFNINNLQENVIDDDVEEENKNQLNIFCEESTIENEVEELLEDSNEKEAEEPVEESKVDLGSIGDKFEEEEIQEDFVELEDEFTFDIEG
tara:strand:+ start:60 stop:728 length:669 start_codon:yes stop_codon:yes gene_type:complete